MFGDNDMSNDYNDYDYSDNFWYEDIKPNFWNKSDHKADTLYDSDYDLVDYTTNLTF
jgi:hypothetical protein